MTAATGPQNVDLEPVTLAGLAPRKYWVAWQTELRSGGEKPTKIPYNPNRSGRAKADAPKTWGTREAAERRAAELPVPYGTGGVGLELTTLNGQLSLGGVDLDSCRDSETGEIAPWAQAVIDRLHAYTEISPSGTGVKVFYTYRTEDAVPLRTVLGTTAGGGLKWSSTWSHANGADHPPAIEIHLGHRYFTVTGLALPNSNVELRTVPTPDLLHVIKQDGPQFAAKANKKQPGSSPGLHRTLAGQERHSNPKQDSGGQDKSRSATAFRIGADARRRGADFNGMCKAIRTNPQTASWYAEKGVADNGRELHRIWDKAEPTKGELVISVGAPLVTAQQFILRTHTAAGARTLHHQNGTFHHWQGSHYIERVTEEMRAALYRFLAGALTYDEKDELVPFNPTKVKVANVLEAAAAEAQLSRSTRPPAWLENGNPPANEIIACKNVLLHLPTRKTRPHTPAFFTLNGLPFDYQASPPVPTAWLAFLASIWPDDPQAIDTLQELFGLCLAADTSHQKAFLIVGPKRSGKGTIARILTELLGAANVCSPTLGSLSTNFGLAPLIGKRLAVISDARLSGKTDHAVIVERLLAITGEDSQTIDRKFREAWTGKLDTRFLILTNELPRLTDSSGALASRFVVLKMVRTFYGQEDQGLLQKLTPELPGIFGWAIDGWKRLTTRGHFVSPKSSADAVREMEDLGSPIGAFLRECCIIHPHVSVGTNALYNAWCQWCHAHGWDRFGTTQTFGRDLGAALPELRTTQQRTEGRNRERLYQGVDLSR